MKRILLTSLLGMLATACQTPSKDGAAGVAQPPAASGALDVIPVTSAKLDTHVRLPGELTAYESVAIYPRVTGFVEEVLVDRGSNVKQGQLLARLSAPELAAQRTEAQSKLAAAKSTFDRLKAASATPGVVAGHDLELAEAGLQAEKAHVESLYTLEAYLLVKAPFDGVVSERNVHPGALVGPPAGSGGTPMLRIDEIGKLRLTVAVPESETAAIAEGAQTTFTVAAWPGQKLQAKVARVSHVIDPRTRTMAVELDVDNSGPHPLAPGMYAEVDWPVRRDNPTLFVPASSIVQTTERTFVDRVRDGAIDQVTIKRGITVGEKVEIFGELAAGDQVLKRGSETMATGTKVTTKPWTPPDGGPGK
jgi:RND family efflux transporter MFP subunit